MCIAAKGLKCIDNLNDDRMLSVKEKYILFLNCSITSCKPRDSSQAHICPSTPYTLWPDFYTDMLTTFKATASVDVDLTLDNKMDIGSRICILVATQGDASPLCPSSFKEEDMLKLCVGVG